MFYALLLDRMSCLVNCNVVLKPNFLGVPSVVYPWKILAAEQPGVSLRQFYSTIDIPQSSSMQLALEHAYLGKSKTELDLIDLDIELQQAVTVFGCFLKYFVTDLQQPTQSSMTAGQPQLQLPSLTPPTRIVNNKKDKLYNDILLLLDHAPAD